MILVKQVISLGASWPQHLKLERFPLLQRKVAVPVIAIIYSNERAPLPPPLLPTDRGKASFIPWLPRSRFCWVVEGHVLNSLSPGAAKALRTSITTISFKDWPIEQPPLAYHSWQNTSKVHKSVLLYKFVSPNWGEISPLRCLGIFAPSHAREESHCSSSRGRLIPS